MPDTLAPSIADVVELTRALVRCESVTPVGFWKLGST